MSNAWAFLPAREANELLDDPEGLRARLDDDGYLLLRGVLPVEPLKAVRRDITDVLLERGWIHGGAKKNRAVARIPPLMESDDEFQDCYARIQGLQSFHEAAHLDELAALMKKVLGPTAFAHPLKVARLAFPLNFETATPPHQDFPNNQGTSSLTASWIPLGDIGRPLGGLAILRGSHKEGVLEMKGHLGPGNRQAAVPDDVLERCRWVTTDYALGDVVLFPSTTVHASLANTNPSVMRLSVDFRWQLEGQALTPGCLEPHGRRVDWADVYDGWTSDRWQYYWHDLDFELTEMRGFDIRTDAAHNEEMLRLQMQHRARLEAFTPQPDTDG